jgi:hypothetical protein
MILLGRQLNADVITAATKGRRGRGSPCSLSTGFMRIQGSVVEDSCYNQLCQRWLFVLSLPPRFTAAADGLQ